MSMSCTPTSADAEVASASRCLPSSGIEFRIRVTAEVTRLEVEVGPAARLGEVRWRKRGAGEIAARSDSRKPGLLQIVEVCFLEQREIALLHLRNEGIDFFVLVLVAGP